MLHDVAMPGRSDSDVTIVGGGLSGCVLALEALDRGMSVRLIDRGSQRAASRAAAGVINPITGMRFSRSWRVDEFLPVAIKFYQRVEHACSACLWHPQPICRLFRSPELREGFFKRRSLEQLAPYAVRLVEPAEAVGPVENYHGGIWIKGGGWVDLAVFLDVVRPIIEQKGEWIEAEPDMVDLCDSSEGIVIDCRGYQPDHALWPQLDWKPARGDILTLQSNVDLPSCILNRSQFVLRLGDGRFRFGATYDWEFKDTDTSLKARKTLMKAFVEWVRIPDAEVVDQRAGIRPILRNQRPVLGRHPQRPNLAIFNGMGSKGGLWAPFLAGTLLDHLWLNTKLDREIDIRRFGER